MPLPVSLVLQELHSLDRSSPGFSDQLNNLLCRQDYLSCEKVIGDDDVMWLVNYLDTVLSDLDPASQTSRRCLRALRSICGTRRVPPASYILTPNLLEIDRLPLTSGGSCDVYKGTLNGSDVCIKRVRVYVQNEVKATKAFYKEAVTWNHLVHPNVLPFLGITIHPLQLISKWVFGGDLPEYIQKHPDADRIKLLCGVAEGLSYLHSCNVIHGDLKGPNILVEDRDHVRVADFGLAKVARGLNSMRSVSCQNGFSMRWTAPEVLDKWEYSEKADVFSFSMVMIEVFTGALPFCECSSFSATLDMARGRRPPRPTHPTLTVSLWELMQHCWDPEPQSRPDVSEVLQVFHTLNPPDWKQLISSPLSTEERAALITSIFSDPHGVEVVGRLSGSDAQSFLDRVDEALDNLTPPIRRKCLTYLSRTCSRQSLLPVSLQNSICYNPTGTAQYHDEIVTVWKGKYNGRMVAVKVSRPLQSDLGHARKRFYEEVVIWKTFHHLNILPLLAVKVTENEFTTISEWMERGNIGEFVRAHPDINRLGLLTDVAEGLVYMHDRGIAHGNLDVSNILINNDNRACLAGFSLLTSIQDELVDPRSNPTPSTNGIQGPAPEILSGGAPSMATDMFSFSMVMIEVFNGTTSLGEVQGATPTFTTTQGKRPPRPKHPDVTGRLWKLIQRCWDDVPSSRPEAPKVLQTLFDSNPPAWKRLIGPSVSVNERINLTTAIFSDRDEAEDVGRLAGDGAQAFVDVIDEILESWHSIPPIIHRRCVRALYAICGREPSFPKSLSIPLCCNPADTPRYSGVFADVWKGNHDGLEVAAKALRVYRTSDFDEIRKRFCKEVIAWRALRHPNVLPLLGMTMEDKRFVMVSEWMKNGNIIDFLKNKGADRLELVVGVTRGLVYMHDQGIVHGNLDGHNIMIDDNGCAVVAGFNLITLVPGQSTLLSSCMDAGAVQWMSPELLNPEKFGLSGSRQTKESDCYALGMVAYEILSGCAPFGTNGPFTILRKITDGEHPERPQGEAGKLFTDNIWDMLDCCWETEPRVRASAKDVLRCLDGNGPIVDRGDGESDALSADWLYVGLDDPEDSAGLSTASNRPKPLDLPPSSPISGPPGPVLLDSVQAGLFEGRMDQ